MNVSTLLISHEEARRKLNQYKSIVGRRRLKEDDQLESLYASVVKGARVLNLAAAFRETGLNEKGEPRLALARADWKKVNFFPRIYLGREYLRTAGSGGFTDHRRWESMWRVRNVALPPDTFTDDLLTRYRLSSNVPHIPPNIRPKYSLHNYHVLFEVQDWKQYPVDPYLMRRISGMLFVVEAEWDLTPLEAALLSSM